MFEIFCHLSVGSTVYITSNIFDLDEIRDILLSQSITSLHLVPSQYDVLSTIVNESSVSKIYFSGEALTAAILSDLRKDIVVYNYYGPTEAGEITGYKPKHEDEALVIGKIFSNSTSYVFDKNGGIVPMGVSGELYIGIIISHFFISFIPSIIYIF